MRRWIPVATLVAAAFLSVAPASAASDRQAFLVVVEPMSFEEALKDPILAGIGRSGGLGLLTSPSDERVDRRDILEILGDEPPGGERIRVARADAPEEEIQAADLVVVDCCEPDHSRYVRDLLRRSSAGEVAVVAVPASPTEDMRSRRDDVLPVAFAVTEPDALFPPCSTIVQAGGGSIEALPGCLAGLTSDTTRRPGLVSTHDVWPTLLAAIGVQRRGDDPGYGMRVDDVAPIAIHERYLGYRRVHTAAGTGVLAVVLLGLLGGVGVLFFGRGAPPLVMAAASWVGLVGIAGAVSLLAASALPRFASGMVLAVAGGGAIALSVIAMKARPGDAVAPVAVVASVGMLLVLVDGMLGWRALFMPLLGGSSLEGVRFYGLGNGFGGLLAAGSILTATRLRPWAGTVLLASSGMLAGLPGFGANLGVATTLFAAAGLWHLLRGPGSVMLRLLGGGALAAALLVALLAAHRMADMPTHVTRAVEAGSPLSTAVERFVLNVRNTSAHPAGWLPVVMLPAALWMAWRRVEPFGDVLGRDPAWRHGIVTLAIAGIVGFLVNDTVGVAGLSFAFSAAALVHPALVSRVNA